MQVLIIAIFYFVYSCALFQCVSISIDVATYIVRLHNFLCYVLAFIYCIVVFMTYYVHAQILLVTLSQVRGCCIYVVRCATTVPVSYHVIMVVIYI